jgi:hypothetical protein
VATYGVILCQSDLGSCLVTVISNVNLPSSVDAILIIYYHHAHKYRCAFFTFPWIRVFDRQTFNEIDTSFHQQTIDAQGALSACQLNNSTMMDMKTQLWLVNYISRNWQPLKANSSCRLSCYEWH